MEQRSRSWWLRPTQQMVWIAVGWLLLALMAVFSTEFLRVWQVVGWLLLALALVDAVLTWRSPWPIFERELPERCAIGQEFDARLILRNPGHRRSLTVAVFEGLPLTAECDAFPARLEIEAGGHAIYRYPLRLLRRGRATFAPLMLRLYSPLNLWSRFGRLGEATVVRVFPNYQPIIRYALLALEHQESQMGIVQRNRPGMSREFEQLREYHDGDRLNQIDWKATARQHKLISREYTEQRDQQIVLLLDSGRRMRNIDGDLSQFDHCLNAALLTAFIALRQGDKVGVMAFGGNQRWLPPAKGPQAMTNLLHHLYDYQTTMEPSDFSEAAARLMQMQKRRALVVVVTNLRSEDASDIVPALQTMQQRHLVLLASLREAHMRTRVHEPVQTTADALELAATYRYLGDRQQVFDQLATHRIITLDAVAEELPVALSNCYLSIKKSGRL